MARIVHVTSVHWAYDIRIFQKECRSLADAGHDVSLVAPHDRDEVRDGVRILGVPPRRGRLARMLGTARDAIGRARRVDADLYHLHDPELLFWAATLRRRGAPVVYDMHEDLPRQIRTKTWLPSIARGPLAALAAIGERSALRNRPVVLAETSYGQNRPWLSGAVEVLNYPRLEWLDDQPAPTFPRAENRIGYLGTVTESRGCLVTIEAVRILAERGVPVVFDCVGPVEDGLEEIAVRDASAKGVAERINLTGRMPAAEAWRLISGCSIGLVLLAPLPNYLESFPTKMFEYMALGLPVVVSDFPSYRAIVEKWRCGRVVDPLDPTAVADVIAELLADPETCAEMGARGAAAARSVYSWASEEARLLALYEDLLGEAGSK